MSPLGHENVLNICQTPIMKSIQSLIWQPVKIALRSLTVQLEVEPKWSLALTCLRCSLYCIPTETTRGALFWLDKSIMVLSLTIATSFEKGIHCNYIIIKLPPSCLPSRIIISFPMGKNCFNYDVKTSDNFSFLSSHPSFFSLLYGIFQMHLDLYSVS